MILRNGKRIDGCSDTVPIGSLNPFLGTTAPYGYLICAGQLVSKTTYPELYAICGDTYGTATATEFYLPDLRGRTIVGYKEGDTNFGTLGGLVGSITSATGNHTLTAAESGLPSHYHTGWHWGAPGGSSFGVNNSGTGTWRVEYTTAASEAGFYTGYTGGDAASSAHNHGDVSTIQPSINLNWIVKAFMLIPNQSIVINTESDSSTNVYSANFVNSLLDQMKQEAFDFAHPIGGFYETTDADWTPQNAGWYGTWVRDDDGSALVSYKSSGAFNKTPGTIVGSETSTHNHSLSRAGGANFRKYGTIFYQGEYTTAGTMPSQSAGDCWWCTDGNNDYSTTVNPGTKGVGVGLYGSTDNGSSSTIQTSKVVYRWHRTA